MALTDKLSAIADAIRDKTGKTDGLTLDQMPNEISNIQSGGGGGGDRTMEDGLVARTLTEYINNTVTSIGNYAFGNFTSLEYVSLPNVTEIVGGNHFASCTNLRSVNIPKLKTSISSSGNNFRGCTSLTELRFPLYNGILSVSGCTS